MPACDRPRCSRVEARAGVSIYFVNEEIDAGELCGQRVFDILPEETLDQLLRWSKAIAADLLGEVLDRIEAGTVTRTPMDLDNGSYYSWPKREAVERFARAAGGSGDRARLKILRREDVRLAVERRDGVSMAARPADRPTQRRPGARATSAARPRRGLDANHEVGVGW